MKKTLLLTIGLCAALFASAQIPANGLIAFYPCNGNGNDIGPNQYNAESVNAVGFVTDRNGNGTAAASFGGETSQMLLNADEDTLLKPTEAFTISMWFAVSDLQTNPYPTMLKFRNAANTINYYTLGLVLNFDPQDYVFYGGSQSNGESVYAEVPLLSTGIAPNTWVNSTLVYTGSAVELYLNNTLLASTPMDSLDYDETVGYVAIGSNYNDSYFNGYIDDIAFYNRALNPAERAQLVNDTTSTIEVVEEPNSIAEQGKNANISLYPNPANDMLNIATTGNFNRYSIIGVDGKEIMSDNFNKQSTVAISNLAAGLYNIKLTNTNGQVATRRFIKQ
ncbi:MAG: T9SS type A sorting domain-containing protein [Sphingobacteriales bacterium JAD_PAG50586_3]|nr:MAG: T9SS type A sorting domain-containing protein [Sphingobacteriales bacterium JAD_PAG50586_3]